MKILIFVLFLSIPSYSQNFMMNMNVQEVYEDTSIYHYNIKVIWGIKEKKICFLWADHFPMCFTEKKYTFIIPKRIRKKMEEIMKILEAEEKDEYKEEDEYIKVRQIYYNQWRELFLITVYINEGTMIRITRLDDKSPHYFLTMTK